MKYSKDFYRLSRMPLDEVYNLFWQFPIFGYLDCILYFSFIKRRLQWVFLNTDLSITLPISGENHLEGITVDSCCVRILTRASQTASEDGVTLSHGVSLHDTRFIVAFLLLSIFLIVNRKHILLSLLQHILQLPAHPWFDVCLSLFNT